MARLRSSDGCRNRTDDVRIEPGPNRPLHVGPRQTEAKPAALGCRRRRHVDFFEPCEPRRSVPVGPESEHIGQLLQVDPAVGDAEEIGHGQRLGDHGCDARRPREFRGMDAGAPQFFDATAFANEGFEPIRCRVLGVLRVPGQVGSAQHGTELPPRCLMKIGGVPHVSCVSRRSRDGVETVTHTAPLDFLVGGKPPAAMRIATKDGSTLSRDQRQALPYRRNRVIDEIEAGSTPAEGDSDSFGVEIVGCGYRPVLVNGEGMLRTLRARRARAAADGELERLTAGRRTQVCAVWPRIGSASPRYVIASP